MVRLINAITYLNFVVAFSAGFLSYSWCLTSNIDSAVDCGLFVGSGTFVLYNFQRLIKVKSKQSIWLDWVKANRTIIYLSVALAGFVALYAFSKVYSLINFQLLIFSAVLGIFYVVPIPGYKALRDLPYLKVHIIALTWSLLITCLFDAEVNLVAVIAHYFYVLAVTIPFDIRDLDKDEASQKNIPQRLGVVGAKVVAVVALLGYAFIAVFYFYDRVESNVLVIALLTQLLLIFFTTKKRPNTYYALAIDGCISLLGLTYYLSI